ncbi:MAG: type II CAAX endopeptidase family protein [Hespellia sp.]|nr:type II CAAX endopeptidase family protein [Hespellia sp.]
MEETKRPTEELSTSRAILGIIFAITILVIAQILAFSISEIPLNFGVPGAVCNIIAGILYVAFALLGTMLLSKKFLKISMVEMRIPRIQLKTIWLISAVLMPILVLLIAVLVGGHWQTNTFDTETALATVTSAVAFFGLATGIVEEIIFRGIIMRCLEKKFNIKVAIIIPSVLFGLLHIFGNELDFVSIIQLLIAGSIVGVLFSLIAYESNSIWNSAIVHGVWNMTIIGGILYIGKSADSDSIFNFVLENKSFLFSGGDFGIEASVISVFVYLIFIAVAIVLLKKGNR